MIIYDVKNKKYKRSDGKEGLYFGWGFFWSG